jgi:WD40 repeat protein
MGLWPQGRQGLALAFSPDGKRLAVGHQQAVTIWEEGKKKPVAFLKDYDQVSEDLKVLQGFLGGAGYQRILWTSDGKQVVAFGRENLMRGRVWDVAGGNPVALMPPTLTNFIRVTEAGKLLATCVPGEDGHAAVQLIDLTTRKQLGVFKPAPVRNIAISRYQAVASADGKHVAIAGAGLVPGEVWDIKKKSLLVKLEKAGDRNIAGFAQEITGDGKIIIGASHNFGNEDGRILFWDAATGKLLAEHKAHDGPIHTLALSPDGTLLASGSEDGTVRIWELKKLLGGKAK